MNAPDDYVDALARRRIAEDLRSTIIVEAGAGTGKTSALVARIVGLVLNNECELREVAAITFTEAAAGELRLRIHQALRAVHERSPEDQSVLRAIDQLDEVTITTIHGFAERILADHAIEARLPLRFSVLDDIGGLLFFNTAFERLIEELFEDEKLSAVVQCATLLGSSVTQLRGLARLLFEDLDASKSLVVRGKSDPSVDIESIVNEAVEATAASLSDIFRIQQHCVDDGDRLRARIVELEPVRRELDSAADWIDRLFWLVGLDQQRVGNLGRKEAWGNDTRDEARDAMASYEAVRSESLALLGRIVITVLGERFALESLRAGEERRSLGTLTFSDLLVFARDLIIENGAVRRAVQRRCRFILVDEFQDTDPMQLEIILALSTATEQGSGSSLFFVGDPKQSIYRFRGADVALYERAKVSLVGAELLELVTNFRSRPGVLSFVNEIFARVSQNSLRSIEQGTSSAQLQAARPSAGADCPVMVIGGASKEQLSAAERRHLEAVEIADAIVSLTNGECLVEQDGSVRRAKLSDIAIVVPRRSGLSELEFALSSRDLAYRLQSSTLIYDSSEVHELISCLSAIDHPGDERAVMAALRTAAFCCSDQDLASYAAAGGQWRIDLEPPPWLEGHRVAACLTRLRAYRDRVATDGPLDVLLRLIEQEQVLSSMAGSPTGEESLRHVRFFIDRVRSFIERGGSTISELLTFAALEQSVGTRGVEAPSLNDADAIRILTIHGAKGLEFPIVILAELGGPFQLPSAGARLYRNSEGEVALRASSALVSEEFKDLADLERQREREELWRLFYVGATRARDHLIMSLHHSPTQAGEGSLAEVLFGLCQEVTQLWRAFEFSARASTDPATTSAAPDGAADVADKLQVPGAVRLASEPERFSSWKKERDALITEITRPRSMAASAIAEVQSVLERRGSPVRTSSDDDPIGWSRRGAASALGRAVHAVLQRIDLDRPTDLSERAQIEARALGIDERTDEVERLVRSVLSAPAVRASFRSSRVYRELPIAVGIDGGVLECVIDLCYLDGDGFVVVDYKTDAIGDHDDVAMVASRYRLQAGAYALALEQVTGTAVDRVVLVFAAPTSGAAEVEVEDLAGAVAQSRTTLVRAFAPSP